MALGGTPSRTKPYRNGIGDAHQPPARSPAVAGRKTLHRRTVRRVERAPFAGEKQHIVFRAVAPSKRASPGGEKLRAQFDTKTIMI
jgi:hypothetical protein